MIRISRWVIATVSLLLLAVFVTPLWRIDLVAPQYPEGIGLRIWIDRITGLKPNDLNSLNGLNHYIGMRAIVPESIPELRLMPYLLAGAIVAGLLVAVVGRRPLLYVWAALFSLGAVVGLGDFWKWGYTYGHDLDPHAAIKVPGMSYPAAGDREQAAAQLSRDVVAGHRRVDHDSGRRSRGDGRVAGVAAGAAARAHVGGADAVGARVSLDSLATPMASHLVALRVGPAADSLRPRLGGIWLTWDRIPAGGHDG
jgi:copper chaperone NosL